MANDVTPRNIDQKALRAMVTNAFFQWPSAVNIALFLVFFLLNIQPFAFWQSWMWLIAGALSEVVYLVATVTDPKAQNQALAQMLTEQFNPNSVRNLSARQRMQKAIEYKKLIDTFVSAQGGALRSSLEGTASDINDWIARIYQLAKSIDAFESNTVMDEQRRKVPQEIADLKRRLGVETDPGVKAEVNEAIQIRQQFLDNLQNVANRAKRAELQMDNTLAQLGTVYTQMQLIDVKSLDGGRAKRLRDSIHEEIASLSDTISAMDDVYQSSAIDTSADASLSGAVNNLAAPDSSASAAVSSSQKSQSGGSSRN